MNLWFRLTVLLWKFLFRRGAKHSFDATVRTTFHVWPNDLDTNVHMNNGRYLTLMDLGRLDFIARTGLLWPTVRRGLKAVLGASQIIYLRPLLLGQRFELQTRLVFWDAKWFVIEQTFFRGEQLVAKALVRGLFRRGKTNHGPADVFSLGGAAAPQLRPPSPEVAAWLESLSAQRDAARKNAKAAAGPALPAQAK